MKCIKQLIIHRCEHEVVLDVCGFRAFGCVLLVIMLLGRKKKTSKLAAKQPKLPVKFGGFMAIFKKCGVHVFCSDRKFEI